MDWKSMGGANQPEIGSVYDIVTRQGVRHIDMMYGEDHHGHFFIDTLRKNNTIYAARVGYFDQPELPNSTNTTAPANHAALDGMQGGERPVEMLVHQDHNEPVMDIKEFRELGYLQEVNRQFFHPHGLALSITQSITGEELLGDILDYRDDDEGVYYNIANSHPDVERVRRFVENRDRIYQLFHGRSGTRKELLGWVVEPIPFGK